MPYVPPPPLQHCPAGAFPDIFFCFTLLSFTVSPTASSTLSHCLSLLLQAGQEDIPTGESLSTATPQEGSLPAPAVPALQAQPHTMQTSQQPHPEHSSMNLLSLSSQPTQTHSFLQLHRRSQRLGWERTSQTSSSPASGRTPVCILGMTAVSVSWCGSVGVKGGCPSASEHRWRYGSHVHLLKVHCVTLRGNESTPLLCPRGAQLSREQ